MTNGQGGKDGNEPDIWYQRGQWVADYVVLPILDKVITYHKGIAIFTAGLAFSVGGLTYWNYSHARPDTPSSIQKGIRMGSDGIKYEKVGFEGAEKIEDISDLVTNRTIVRPEGARSRILYKIPESQVASVKRQVYMLMSEIRRKHGRCNIADVYKAPFIDRSTGLVDDKHMEGGYVFGHLSDFEDISKVIKNWEIVTSRR